MLVAGSMKNRHARKLLLRDANGSKNDWNSSSIRKRSKRSSLKQSKSRWGRSKITRSHFTRCLRNPSKKSRKKRRNLVARSSCRLKWINALLIWTSWMSMRSSTTSSSFKCSLKRLRKLQINRWFRHRRPSHRSIAASSTREILSKSKLAERWKKRKRNWNNSSLRRRKATLDTWLTFTSQTQVVWNRWSSKTWRSA